MHVSVLIHYCFKQFIDYHFDSNGKKLPNKWDNFDVDAELNKIDDEMLGEVSPRSNEEKDDPVLISLRKKTKEKLLRTACELQHEMESILSFMDTNIRGDIEIKSLRKNLVLEINNEYLPRLDDIKTQLELL